MQSYLIHIKYADKEPYSPDEVYSVGITVNGVPKYKSYLEIYRERKKAWEDRIIEEDQEERRERDESILKAEEERYEAENDEAARLYQMRKAREEY